MGGMHSVGGAMVHACNCIGPQNGQPKCPCMMRGVVQRDGRWIEPERDLGPVIQIDRLVPGDWTKTVTSGCVCPPGSEMTCQGAACPRRGPGYVTSRAAP